MIDSNNLQTNKYSSLKVSRETLYELDQYSKEILKRNKHINLISKNSEKQINSIVCAVSSICLIFIDSSVLLLIRLTLLFSSNIAFEYSSRCFNVSRETFGTDNLSIFI